LAAVALAAPAAAAAPGLHLSCTGWSPSGKGIIETGAAGSPSFANTRVGPFVSQTTSGYWGAEQASAYWARAVRRGLGAGVVQTENALAKLVASRVGTPTA